jgi:predicted enzyme related to lactoylglutathione lyase
MPTDQKIDYIELPGASLDAAEHFYTKTFGWSFVDYGPEYRAFSDGKLDGGFYRSELKSTAGNGAALVVLYAKNLEATRDAVIANGGSICREIFTFPGGRRLHFQDPNGNELAVWTEN